MAPDDASDSSTAPKGGLSNDDAGIVGAAAAKNIANAWLGIDNVLNRYVQSAVEPALDRIRGDLLSSLGASMPGGSAGRPAPGFLERLTTDFFTNRSRPQDFPDEDEPQTSYSTRLRSAGDYFSQNEGLIESMEDLNKAIRILTEKAQAVPLVWRGQQNADWALHSSLFRSLAERAGVKAPQKRPKGVQPFPTEDDMIAAEVAILRVARESWRFEGLSALETFARLQHHGAPTRLLDVSRNPYIAAWFAVESHDDEDGSDARLFALATRPVPRPGEPTERLHGLVGPLSSSREPFWHALVDNRERQAADWGTGANRRVWVPPEYDPRIAAQNAAFVLDGVPMISSRTSRHFKTSDGQYWSKADLLASSSLYARMYSPTRRPPANATGLAPTFSFRITASAKEEIRRMLERWFSYSRATIYPDIGGLAQHVKHSFNEIVDTRPVSSM